ncbi:MAG: hypothetical protein OEW11_11445 [Nitrospirota bacterium]|nr:hypothetical protein [Nitrospirota bacterium]
MKTRIITALLALLLVAPAAWAQAPLTIPYSGLLIDNGVPVTANATLTFSLYGASTGGTPRWTETVPGVAVVTGRFATDLGGVSPLTVADAADPAWLEVSYGATVLTPRVRLQSVPFAFMSQQAVTAQTAQTASAVALNSVDGASVLNGSITAADVNTATIQARVTGTCAAGQKILPLAADGTVTCGIDADTTYTAGNGLMLTGPQLSVDTTAIQARVTGTCTAGQKVLSIAANGTVTCGIDADTTYAAGNGLVLSGTTFGVLLGANSVSGSNLVTGAASVAGAAFTRDASLPTCVIYGDQTGTLAFTAGTNCRAAAPISLPHGATVNGLTCLASDGAVGTGDITVTLYQKVWSPFILNTVATTGPSLDGVTNPQILTSPPFTTTVDNTIGVYVLRVDFASDASAYTTNLALYGCVVNYN